MIELRHGRVRLALHKRKTGTGTPLLLLHELGSASSAWPDAFEDWAGDVYALDFSGHGASASVKGGGYTPELLAGDTDLALERIGTAALAGAGIGAYVALLIAGARPDLIPAALLLPGRGLAGGGPLPMARSSKLPFLESAGQDRNRPAGSGEDALLSLLEHDIRPVSYAEGFAHSARCLLMATNTETNIPWWQAAMSAPSARPVPDDLEAALKEVAVATG